VISQSGFLGDLIRSLLLWGAISADPSDVMSRSSDNLSGSSLEEILRAETENRAWSKTLRQRATELLNSRVAKAITFEEYAVFRQQANEDAAECKRQATILRDELRRRDRRYLLKSNLENEPLPEIDTHSGV
jgi:hypothetical protein